jgi:isopentenyl diphosphate isomerase/L-lactate dehydrogenase-like FMN-dependent dehydrogenase
MFNVQQVLNSEEIVEDLEAALEQFREIAADLAAPRIVKETVSQIRDTTV